VFEKVNGGPLLTRLQEQIHFTEREASQIIRDLASALQFLHVKGKFIRLRLRLWLPVVVLKTHWLTGHSKLLISG
jgi:serine/threonine protein kinase